LEREDVGQLVPQRAAPVKFTARPAGRAIHRDHVTECHAEQPDAWQGGDAYGEVVVIWVQLEGHGYVQREAVTLRELLDALARQLHRVRPQRRRFAAVQAQLHFDLPAHGVHRFADELEFTDAIEQAQRVDYRGAVRIAGIGLGEMRTRLRQLAQPQQVRSEL